MRYIARRRQPCHVSRRFTPVPLVAILAAVLSLGGCDLPMSMLFDETDCLVVPGAPHPALAACGGEANVSWTVRWRDDGGKLRELRHVTEPTVIRLPSRGVTPVILIEESSLPGYSAAQVPAAGALFPQHASEGTRYPELKPDRIKGATARCAEAVVANAPGGNAEGMAIVSGFDWLRLDALVGELEYPAQADVEGIARRILGSSFSSRYAVGVPGEYLEIGPCAPFEPGDLLFHADPAVPPVPFTADGLARVSVHDGLNRFFSARGTLDLESADGQIVCTFFLSYD